MSATSTPPRTPEKGSATTTRTYADSARPLPLRLLLTRDAAVLGLLVAVVSYSVVAIPNFDSQLTIYFLVLDIAPILLIALPMTLVIVTGEIDLSVASIVAVTSVLFGVLTREGAPIALAAVLAVLAGALAGAVNGLLVTKLGLPSLAVTIGTLALYRGVAVGLLGTTAITDWPDTWTDAVTATFGESQIPVIVVPLAVAAALFGLLLHLTSFGRGLFAIGLSSESARFSGVDVERTKLVAFVLTGLVSGIAGVYFTLRYGSSRGDNATGLELQVIAAVLLGGVSIFGGRGAIPGVLGGVLLIGVIGSALRLDGQSANVIQIVTGVLLIASVVSAALLGWVSRRVRRRPPTAAEAAPPAVPTAGGM
ncbi:ABC transporter permease [Nocardioides sp. CFH 31398]|uniref:ABC transporter permease n=1 Tax=Nocardioides sp. CFH 31398 TaxID=2919579 RepID=UPI001F067CCF|nr:ABC transporter permease [Nocardioides sp. CFH 31398]MCH1867740.1 ABC transporter permease [Nocardioides sp. CFH 31398]